MSAREEVLGAVRRAVAGAAGVSTDGPGVRGDTGPGGGPDTDVPAAEVVALFAARVADYRAEVTRCSAEEVPGVLAGLLSDRSVVVPEGFPHEVPHPVTDSGLDAASLDRVDAVVTTATVAIAETGTIVLDHGAGQGRRALSLVPDVHVCLVAADQVVPDVPEAVRRLDPRRPQTWISGPSATSDIELSRVEGVHGPRALHVVLVG